MFIPDPQHSRLLYQAVTTFLRKKVPIWPNVSFSRIRHFTPNTDPDPDPIHIQGLVTKNFEKITGEKKEAFSPQKRTSSTSIHEISELSPIFVGHFTLLDADTDSGCGYGSTDPDPKHWFWTAHLCCRHGSEAAARGRDGGAGGGAEQVREGAPHQDDARGESQVNSIAGLDPALF